MVQAGLRIYCADRDTGRITIGELTDVSNNGHTSLAYHHTILHRPDPGSFHGGGQEPRFCLSGRVFCDVGAVRAGDDPSGIICKI